MPLQAVAEGGHPHGDSGPGSWQFWGPNRQLLATEKQESAQASAGGASGPDSWQFWGPNRQLLTKESAQVSCALAGCKQLCPEAVVSGTSYDQDLIIGFRADSSHPAPHWLKQRP